MVNRPLSLLAYGAILLVITTNAFASPKEADPRWLILSVFSRIGYPSHLSVRIVLAGRSVREGIFGEAYTDSEGKGTYIKLYYAHLAEPNAHLPLGEGELLGYVIAHEVGHLLLGTDSHSHEGIMQGRWEDPQLREAGKGNLQFTPSQAGLMREHLAGEEKRKESRRSTGNPFR